MAAYRRVYDSRQLQADCQEPGSAPEPYARLSSMGYLFYLEICFWATTLHIMLFSLLFCVFTFFFYMYLLIFTIILSRLASCN